jgi:hypothetical protein
MKYFLASPRILTAVLSTLFLMLVASPSAIAAPDPAQFRLTDSLLQRINTVNQELKKAGHVQDKDDEDEDDDDDEDDDASDAKRKKEESIEGIAAKVEKHPEIKAALARHGLTPTDYALATHALLHAAMFVMFEKSMDPQKAKDLLGTYTPVQRGNIDVVRRNIELLNKK